MYPSYKFLNKYSFFKKCVCFKKLILIYHCALKWFHECAVEIWVVKNNSLQIPSVIKPNSHNSKRISYFLCWLLTLAGK